MLCYVYYVLEFGKVYAGYLRDGMFNESFYLLLIYGRGSSVI